jgi:fatty acid desaturase
MRTPEWPTVALLALTYALWALATTWAAALWLPLGVLLAALAIAQHSSLSHEALHGHPFAAPRANVAAVWPALGLFVPYLRFRDTHLAHHRDALLTDPYDDPESNYLDPLVWDRLPRAIRHLLRFNNTLLGRLTVGPVVGMTVFLRSDWRAIRAGDAAIRRAWLVHLAAVAPVLIWVWVSAMPVWAYLVSAYGAMSLLKIRTFLEHRAHERASGRTVVIEDRGPLALLFLNNNYHVVHHMHPQVAWYRLPRLYAKNRAHYLARNDGYVYRSYGQIFRRYLLRAKDDVPHPLWPRP